jgi:dipeptide/tripeptide permease
MTSSAATAQLPTSDRGFFGHPKGLFVCFTTEMWERFSFYGMKYLLLLYLTKYHLFSDSNGLEVLGSYAALVYAMPVIGGLLADRYLGMRKAVVFGGILLVLGHLGMAVEGEQARNEAGMIIRDEAALQVFYCSLALIVIGVGFLKPNISTIVGRLYSQDDPRRDAGFTIFYMGINLGAFMATLLCGYLGETYGWRYGFGAAGIGMLIGLATFLSGQSHLLGQAEPANRSLLREKSPLGISKELTIYLCGLVAVGVALVYGASVPNDAGLVVGYWMVLAYLLHTTGELCLSPVGLSAVTKLAVPSIVGVMMGAWFLATAYSQLVAVQLSKLAAMPATAGTEVDAGAALAGYTALFNDLFLAGLAVGAVMLLISPLLKKMMHGIH